MKDFPFKVGDIIMGQVIGGQNGWRVALEHDKNILGYDFIFQQGFHRKAGENLCLYLQVLAFEAVRTVTLRQHAFVGDRAHLCKCCVGHTVQLFIEPTFSNRSTVSTLQVLPSQRNAANSETRCGGARVE